MKAHSLNVSYLVVGLIFLGIGMDANLVRLLVVLGTIFGFGSLLVAYMVAWILMPAE